MSKTVPINQNRDLEKIQLLEALLESTQGIQKTINQALATRQYPVLAVLRTMDNQAFGWDLSAVNHRKDPLGKMFEGPVRDLMHQLSIFNYQMHEIAKSELKRAVQK